MLRPNQIFINKNDKLSSLKTTIIDNYLIEKKQADKRCSALSTANIAVFAAFVAILQCENKIKRPLWKIGII